MSTEIILHNYPQSPVAEKVRVAFGIKQMSWRSVEIPRIPPKPKLVQLTGGYRRTPVMQIGADIYCDSQCIIRELDRRQPEHPLQGAEAGLMWNLSRWTDGALFDLAVKLVLGSAGENLPADFAEDRGRLYLGPDWAEGLKAANANLPHLASQMRAPLAWLNDLLSGPCPFINGDMPGAIDAQFYQIVWFIRGRWDSGASFLSEFENLNRWESAVEALGHGSSSDLDPDDALKIAADCTPMASDGVAPNDPQGLEVGQAVTVSPDVDGGEQPVAGRLHGASADTVSVLRQDEICGEVTVHFPRAGYRVDAT